MKTFTIEELKELHKEYQREIEIEKQWGAMFTFNFPFWLEQKSKKELKNETNKS